MAWYKNFIIVLILFFHIGACAVPLNILFVVGHFPSPSQTFVLNIIIGLIDKGHKVSIFSFHKDNPPFVHPKIKKYKLLDRLMYKSFPIKLSKYDIVFCQFGYLGQKIFQMNNLMKQLKKIKVVICLRGSDISAHIQKDPTMYKKMFKEADLFLPVCNYFKTKLITLGCDPTKIIVHPSAIDCEQFFFTVRKKPQDGMIRFVSTCRLVKKKGLDYALKAFAEVVKRHPNIHYTIIGDGPERTYLELLIQHYNIQNNVTLCGWKSHNEIVSILNKAHIFLSPSRTAPDGNEEGIANALKEAMAMGLISIGTWHAGTPELIDHGISGFLVPEKSICQLTNTINYIIDHPEEWESINLAARKKIENEFETKQSVEKLEKIFYRLIR